MTKTYNGRIEQCGSELRDDGIKYGLSIGRRAPMHQMHVDCLREIIEAGLIPVICIGSTNDADSKHFNPIKAPLTLEQQLEQLRIMMEREFPDHRDTVMQSVFGLKDIGNAQKWSAGIAGKLHELGIYEGCVMHFRAKEDDRKSSAGTSIQPLSKYSESFAQHDISVWQSYNHPDTEVTLSNPDTGEKRELSASAMREWDLMNLTPEQRNAFAAPDYIISLAKQARENNPHVALLNNAGIPITVFDLSLERAWKEAKITTEDVVEIAELTGTPSIKSLKSALSVKLEEHAADLESHIDEQSLSSRWQSLVGRAFERRASPAHPPL